MIDTFETMIKKYGDKDALVYLEGNKIKRKTFSEFKMDILKMISLFKKNNLKQGDKVILFILPSYEFYLFLFAGIYYQLNLIVIDSFKNKRRLKSMIKQADSKFIATNHQTRFISKFFFDKNIFRLSIDNYHQFLNTPFTPCIDDSKTILTTFTSGSTGNPKMIQRSLKVLKTQADLVLNHISFDNNSSVVGLLPIYSLFALYQGVTVLIARKINKKSYKLFEKELPNFIFGSITKLLKIKKPILSIKKGYTGGAIIYLNEAKQILNNFPNGEIDYIYGASEGALIYKTTINKYLSNFDKTPFCFDEKIKDVEVIIDNPNQDGIGEICIKGKSIISVNHQHHTGDLGSIIEDKLLIVGRKKCSSFKDGFYNYIEDQQIRNENPQVKLAFSFIFNDKYYVVYNGKLSIKKDGYTYYKLKRIPLDQKHQTKLNYEETIRVLKLN